MTSSYSHINVLPILGSVSMPHREKHFPEHPLCAIHPNEIWGKTNLGYFATEVLGISGVLIFWLITDSMFQVDLGIWIIRKSPHPLVGIKAWNSRRR